MARLAGVQAALVGACVLLLGLAALPAGLVPPVHDAAVEFRDGGLAAGILPACLLAFAGCVATWLLAAARARPEFAADDGPGLAWRGGAGLAARLGQAVVLPAGAALALLAAWLLWPQAAIAVGAAARLLTGVVLAAAFAALVGERILGAARGPQLPETDGLRRLLLLGTLLLALSGCLEAARSAGLIWVYTIFRAVATVAVAVSLELALRAAARLFLPAPPALQAVAATDSILAGLLTGGLQAPGRLIRTHLGVDFARNWALGYLVAAALPALLLTALLCWGLSGLKLLDQDQRGVYERLGRPVAVLGPGLHLLLPWPLGRLRGVELGVIHTIAIGTDTPPEDGDRIAVEAVPPDSDSRLWTTPHATEVNFLVASAAGAASASQSVQTVSTEMLVLYRTGLTDRDALQSVYAAVDGEQLVRQTAARLATRYFAGRSLDQVMGRQPQTLSEGLRRSLAADLARLRAGIEVQAVVIIEIHPPAGAAAAYHAVQAAEIQSVASISDEIGRATRMRATASQEARQMIDAATAQAAEDVGAARAVAYRFGADRLAYAAGPVAFMTERRLAEVVGALSRTPLTLIDHRLIGTQAPTLDLRRPQALGALPDVAAELPAPAATPPGGGQDDAAAPGTFSYVPARGDGAGVPAGPDALPEAPQ